MHPTSLCDVETRSGVVPEVVALLRAIERLTTLDYTDDILASCPNLRNANNRCSTVTACNLTGPIHDDCVLVGQREDWAPDVLQQQGRQAFVASIGFFVTLIVLLATNMVFAYFMAHNSARMTSKSCRQALVDLTACFRGATFMVSYAHALPRSRRIARVIGEVCHILA